MRWEDSPARPGINFGGALGAPASPTLFRVCILRVPDGDPLPAYVDKNGKPASADEKGARANPKLQGSLAEELPPTIKLTMLTDRTTGIRASVHDVEFELVADALLEREPFVVFGVEDVGIGPRPILGSGHKLRQQPKGRTSLGRAGGRADVWDVRLRQRR